MPEEVKKKESKPSAIPTIVASNRLEQLPIKILEECKIMIGRGSKDTAIQNYIAKTCGKEFLVPDRDTIAKWIKIQKPLLQIKKERVKKEKEAIQRTESELRELQYALNLVDLDITDKRKVLESIIKTLLIRSEICAQYQDNLMDVRLEKVILDQMSQIMEGVKIIAEAENQIGLNEYLARLMVQIYLEKIVPIIQEAFADTAEASKLKQFMTKFSNGIAHIKFDQVRQEAYQKAVAFEKGEIHV